ncbi:hypothetical protein PSTT_10457 [Puccinia striiformis]|uniref:Secreted protein n=1 Tax=Puccinia striiformis TaxID=27350 RepID=A0A2S4V4L7_9BASI|nr:hypothetical protein PSTT_10457 [Puccinia striiformis]
MQATIIFACLAFLALSHQAISTEGQAVTEVAQQAAAGCRPGKLAALALDLDQTEATLPVGDGAETVGTEPIKTPPAMENNGQTDRDYT